MAAQEAEHSLGSVIRGHHMYKYIWTPCLGGCGECARIVSYYAVSLIKDVRWWTTYQESTALPLLPFSYNTLEALNCTLPVYRDT